MTKVTVPTITIKGLLSATIMLSLSWYYVMNTQRGFTLIEVLLGLALLGILGAAIPSALSMANRTAATGNKYTLAESIARSQMDSIQNQEYDIENDPPVYAVLTDVPEPYSIVTPMAVRLDPRCDGLDTDDGLQEITVIVQHGEEAVFTLIDYKVNYHP